MVWFLFDLGSGDIEAGPRNGADCISAFGKGKTKQEEVGMVSFVCLN